MKFIRLECKSVKQMQRACNELDSLGVQDFGLSPIDLAVGVGRGVTFYINRKIYTRGSQGSCDVGDEKYYKRKEFIAAVKRVLGESK